MKKKILGILLLSLIAWNVGSQTTYAATYHFGKTSFTSHVWVNGGAYFYKPTGVDIETIDRKDIYVEYWNTSGKKVHTDTLTWYDNLWDSSWFTPGNASYKIKLVNKSGSGTVDLYQGDVYFN